MLFFLQVEGNLIPYSIIWQKVSPSDPFSSCDSTKTKRIKLSLFSSESFCSDFIEDDLHIRSSETFKSSLVQKRQETSPKSVTLDLHDKITLTESRNSNLFLEVFDKRDGTHSSVTQVYVGTSCRQSSPAQETSPCKKRTRNNSSHYSNKDPKMIKNVSKTEEQEDYDSSSDNSSIDHLDSPPF